MKEIVVITTGWFPEGDAGAVRLGMNLSALADVGYKITVLCRGKLQDSGTVNGVDYISFRKYRSTIGKVFDYYYSFPSMVKKYISNNVGRIYSVYIYNAHISIFEFCKKICAENNIKLIHDCVEWYSPEEFKKGEKSRSYRIKNLINTEIIDANFRVIAISSYLEDYFISKGIKTVRVPVLCDSTIRTKPKAENSDVLTLFYAGDPAGKDLIGNVFKAVSLLSSDEREKLKIVLIGCKKEQLANLPGVTAADIENCSDVLEIIGRVSRSEVLEYMESADFVMLPRNAELRYAKAGFPSKVVEALANATPIFCNLSSDLGDYLTDGENAMVAASHSPEDIANTIRRALKLTPEQKNQMSKNALLTAKENFDYRLYSQKLREILK